MSDDRSRAEWRPAISPKRVEEAVDAALHAVGAGGGRRRPAGGWPGAQVGPGGRLRVLFVQSLLFAAWRGWG
jgi:hypothetical protein